MSAQPNEFADLLDRVAKGDQQAAQQLYDKYANAIALVVRIRLNKLQPLRKLYDTVDFTQEIWMGFFDRIAKGGRFESVEDMMRFLAALADNHVRKAARANLGAKKRDLRRERNLSSPNVDAATSAVADPHPSSAQQVDTDDAFHRWLGFLDPMQRRVALLIRDGFNSEEIAAKIICSVRTVERLRSHVRTVLQACSVIQKKEMHKGRDS
jgi:RNA polymerase sigma factor (sigma-70 family)